MSGEIVPLLRRLQAGDEEAFGRLYAVTNPVLVRYLRVVTDADPAPLALATWATLLPDIAGFVADEDDDWIELAVGTTRTHALEAAAFGSDVPTTPGPHSEAPAVVGADLGADLDAGPVEVGVTTLQACGPAAGEVLAMGAICGLGRDSIARITGREPSEVLALVLDGEARLAQPLTSVMTAMRTPGTIAEVSDLPSVLPLFDAQAHTPLPAPARAASAGTRTVLELLPWDAPAPITAQAMPARGAAAVVSSRWARFGAGAAAWTFALGGVAAAAALIEVVPAALNTLFGGSVGPVVTAHGPTQPSGAPQGGGVGTTPPAPGQQSAPQGPAVPRVGGPSTAGTFQRGGGVVVPASTPGVVRGTQVVVVSAVFTGPSTSPQSSSTQSSSTQSSSTQPTSSAPGPTSVTPPTPTPSPSPGTGGAGGSASPAHVQQRTGNAKGRTKATAATSARTRAKAAHRRAATKAAAAKAAKAKAAAAKSAAAKSAAAKSAKAKAAAHAKAAQSQA